MTRKRQRKQGEAYCEEKGEAHCEEDGEAHCEEKDEAYFEKKDEAYSGTRICDFERSNDEDAAG